MNKKEETVISEPEHADSLRVHRAHHSKTSSGVWRGHGRFGLVLIAAALAVIALVTGSSAETLKPLCAWVTSGPAQPGVPAASYAPDGTTFLGVLHAYFPADITAAYGVDALHTEGWTGTGQTIVIVDSYGSPTALADLQTFSANFGLPAPDLTIVYPDGKPTYNKAMKGIEAGWAMETSLDLQWAHVIAPDAKLVLIAANPAESAGVQGFPSMFKGIQYAIDHYPGSPISQSFGCAEQSFQAADVVQVKKYEKTYQQAGAAQCMVLAAAGDWGTANTDKQGDVYPFQTVVWPASSPSVTAVSGTWLQYGWEWNPLTTLPDLLANGVPGNAVFDAYFNSDSTAGQVEAMWREDWYAVPAGAALVTGGGLSAIFAAPAWQAVLPSSLVQGRRAMPDVSWNAAIDGGVLVMCSPLGGWQDVGGTSASTPQIAGLVALANQLRAAEGKGPLGHLAPALYALPSGDFNDIVPQTFGTGANAVTLDNNQRFPYPVSGLPCLPGYDLTTGLGSPKAYDFVHDLATRP